MSVKSNKLEYAIVGAAAAYAGYKYLDSSLHLTEDLVAAQRLVGLKRKIMGLYQTGFNVSDMFYETYSKFPNKPAIVYLPDNETKQPPRTVTFKDMENLSNQVSNWLSKKGLKRGDTVALFMENRPEFVISWLGMTKIGVKVAMINTSIKTKGLVHCIKISGCKMVLYGSELEASMAEVKDEITALGAMVFSTGGGNTVFPSCDAELAQSSNVAPDKNIRNGIGMGDPFGYIYTSGTTGLPKAAVILHAKMFGFGQLMCTAFFINSDDVVYTVLPLFHSAGGGLGCGMMLSAGCTMVLRKKFSARTFMEDAAKYKVTVVQYIGELCRYLLQTPKGQYDQAHKIRVAVGNGLRPEIWNEFQTRFNIPEIGEFYGATEGNGALFNHCKTKDAQGKCGRMGWLLRKITGVKIVKFDVDNEAIIRGPDGNAIECDFDEPGELLMPIKPSDPSTAFAGYEDKSATEKKIARDVFAKGDMYFRTGDLLSLDKGGYFSFRDRIGDTFRWKGENCSTTEVTEIISTYPGIEDANVYGVIIPNNQDGRAPMAAITPKDGNIKNIDFKALAEHAKKNLPSYAVPLFLRITPQIEVTATMKHQKVELRKQGIDLTQVKDPIYWFNSDLGYYEPFTLKEHQKVTTPGARL